MYCTRITLLMQEKQWLNQGLQNYCVMLLLYHKFVDILSEILSHLSLHSRGCIKVVFVQENPMNSLPVISLNIISASTVRGVRLGFIFLNCASKFSASLGSVFKS